MILLVNDLETFLAAMRTGVRETWVIDGTGTVRPARVQHVDSEVPGVWVILETDREDVGAPPRSYLCLVLPTDLDDSSGESHDIH